MLTTQQVEQNIKNNIKMRIEDIPYFIAVPTKLIITDHIDEQIIMDQLEDYNSR